MPNDKPVIVHVLGTLGSGGAQRMVLQLVSRPELQDFHHVVVCLLGAHGEFLEKFVAQGVPVDKCLIRWPPSMPIPSYRFNRWLRNHLLFLFPYRFAALLRQLQADLVHNHLTSPEIHLQALSVLNIAHLPWLWTIHGLYRSRGEDVSKWGETIRMISQSPAAAITAVSSAALEEIAPYQQPLQGRAMVIHNGIDLSTYKKHSDEVPNLRVEYGIPEDSLVFGLAGRLIKVKRVDVFIESAAIIINKGLSAHFLIAGDGSLRTSLQQKIDQLNMQNHIKLVGYQKNIISFLSALDVFVLSSDSEGLPNAVLEACAMRLPCIATDVGGTAEVLDSGGILVPPGSPPELALAMEKMFSPSVREGYSKKAYEVSKRFSIVEMCNKYGSLYRHLLNH